MEFARGFIAVFNFQKYLISYVMDYGFVYENRSTFSYVFDQYFFLENCFYIINIINIILPHNRLPTV